MTLTIDDVRAAARRLGNRIHRTPVISSQSFDDASGFTVFFKCENLQRAGAFKIRGALNKLLTLSAAERARGVVAFSGGLLPPEGRDTWPADATALAITRRLKDEALHRRTISPRFLPRWGERYWVE